MSNESAFGESVSSRRFSWAQATALLAGLVTATAMAAGRIAQTPFAIGAAYFVWLAFAPVLYAIRVRGGTRWAGDGGRSGFAHWLGPATRPDADPPAQTVRLAWILATLVALLSLSVHWSVGRAFGDLPPAYHDEYSYLFQAKTFLAGRLWFPSHPDVPRLFDQVHVLNEGRFASRYFPGTGLWIAPFLALGHPLWGHWLAGALSSALVFGIGRELGGNGVGLIAGALTALSPGMAVFGNLLLAHHPTLVGLMLFFLCFLRFSRTGRVADGLLAGAGLSFAMLCRPMTAFGFGLPFGALTVWWFLTNRFSEGKINRWLGLACLGSPVLLGLVGMAAYNAAITGDALVTPYQLYTEIYTPRHVYGFHNVQWGERHAGPRVMENYDRWAEDLNAELAVKNVVTRLLNSWEMTLGLVPLLMAAVLFVGLLGPSERRWLLPATAILSLHAVHVPYWYAGIMGWHYVFETGPVWLLMLAAATQAACRRWSRARRLSMPVWWAMVVASALAVWYVPAEPCGRIGRVIDEVAFSRRRYAAFRAMVETQVQQRPALVLVDPDPTDRHIDYVTNDPDLSADVLFGRYQPDVVPLQDVRRAFPDRTLYLFHARDGTLERLDGR